MHQLHIQVGAKIPHVPSFSKNSSLTEKIKAIGAGLIFCSSSSPELVQRFCIIKVPARVCNRGYVRRVLNSFHLFSDSAPHPVRMPPVSSSSARCSDKQFERSNNKGLSCIFLLLLHFLSITNRLERYIASQAPAVLKPMKTNQKPLKTMKIP